MNTNFAMWVVLFTTMVSVSCGLPKTHFYVIDPPHAQSGTLSTIPKRIAVERFHSSEVLVNDRILYREGDNEVNFYEYQRWTSPPVDLVTNYISHRLKDSSAFTHVMTSRDIGKPDFLLRGRVRRFEEVDRGKQIAAEVALEADLVDAKTGLEVWRREEECSKLVAAHTVPSVVQGIQQCLDETANKLINSMLNQIQKGMN